ncbi:MAG: exo-alpha-sialidase [Firmicutes bacterium]|nr:exo-alpha-sialidase [Bacillota bacterium]
MATVFKQGDAGSVCYCTLGCVMTKNGDVLVFCEARISPKDYDAHHLVYKRSVDDGRTWQPLEYFEFSANGECYMNPVPLVDPASGRLFVLYALADFSASTQLFIRHSDDHGITWSERTDLTRLFIDDPHHRAYHLPGPGHGITLDSGRLLVSVWHRHGMRWMPTAGDREDSIFEFDVPEAERGYGISMLYSDDGGSTWNTSEYLAIQDIGGNPFKMSEARIVALRGGQILAFTRGCAFIKDGASCHLKSFSEDEGETWSAPVYDTAIHPPYFCDSGLVSYPGGNLLLSRPASGDMRRRELALYISKDSSHTWHREMIIDPDDAGYSDILVLPNGGILVFYAGNYYNGFFGKDLCFQLIHRSALEHAVHSQ